MIIEFEKVLGAFSLLADIDEAEARRNAPVVKLAIDEVESYIERSDFTGEQRDKLHHAAAACAYYKYVILLSTREGINVELGDAKVTKSDVSIAKAIKEDALSAVMRFVLAHPFAIQVIS